MSTLISILIGVVVTIIFFRFRHLTSIYTERDIERLSEESGKINFLILHWLLRGLDSEVRPIIPKLQRSEKIDLKPFGKYISKIKYNTKIVRVSITPYFEGWVAWFFQIILIALVGSLVFLPTLGAAPIQDADTIYKYLYLLVSIITILLLLPIHVFLSGSMRPFSVIIQDENFSIVKGTLSPRDEKELESIPINKNNIFTPIVFSILNFDKESMVPNGIGFHGENGLIAISHAPRWMIRIFGGADINRVVSQLNKEILNIKTNSDARKAHCAQLDELQLQ